MRPVSDAFIRTLRGSHKMFARVRVLVDFQIGVQPTGTEIPIVDGSVRADASADVRTSLELTTSGAQMWPLQPDDLLAPYGNELFVERGIDYGNGTIEIVSLGYFRIDSTNQEEGPNGQIRLSCSDRMAGIIDARMVTPISFASGTSVETAFETLVLEVYPDATIDFDFDASTATFSATHVVEEDRFGFLSDVARSRGKIIYWDYAGHLRVESPPSPTVTVYTIAYGRDGVLVRLSRELTRRGVYNAVVATGEAPGDAPPIRYVAYDNNVNSPTYWNGRFGHVPRFFYSSFITTVDQASSAAQSILQQAVGLPYSIDLTTVPNPALEPYDVIRIDGPDAVDVHVVDALTIPLTANAAMPVTTRKLLSFEPGDIIS